MLSARFWHYRIYWSRSRLQRLSERKTPGGTILYPMYSFLNWDARDQYDVVCILHPASRVSVFGLPTFHHLFIDVIFLPWSILLVQFHRISRPDHLTVSPKYPGNRDEGKCYEPQHTIAPADAKSVIHGLPSQRQNSTKDRTNDRCSRYDRSRV